MERRLILVFVLTFIVILLSQPLLKKYFPQPAPSPQQTQAQPAATPSPSVAAAQTPPASAVANPGATKQARSETETIIENDLYRITLTNRGAQVKSWILKKFDDEAQNGLLDLVNPLASQKYGYPLSLWTYDESLRNRINSALYVGSGDARLTAPATVTFE